MDLGGSTSLWTQEGGGREEMGSTFDFSKFFAYFYTQRAF
jgi:hypothetical protein